LLLDVRLSHHNKSLITYFPLSLSLSVSAHCCSVSFEGMICLVVAIFCWAGWELGAVEAISLSILVGSSVDYCVHVVEGYLLAGRSPPAHVSQVRIGAGNFNVNCRFYALCEISVACFFKVVNFLIFMQTGAAPFE